MLKAHRKQKGQQAAAANKEQLSDKVEDSQNNKLDFFLLSR